MRGGVMFVAKGNEEKRRNNSIMSIENELWNEKQWRKLYFVADIILPMLKCNSIAGQRAGFP